MVVSYTGNVFQSGAHVVAHQVNCRGVMGAGLALQVKQKYPSVFAMYKSSCRKMCANELLGKIQPCPCGGVSERWIVNMFAQDGFGTGTQQTDYEAFESCCEKLKDWAITNGHVKIAMPYGIGCGLAGGDWAVVYEILKRVFCDRKVDVEIWKLEKIWH